MKKLLLFLLLVPALINAQSGEIGIAYSVHKGQFLSGGGGILTHALNKDYAPPISAIDTFFWSDISNKLLREYSAVIAEKITIGKIPAAVYKPSDFDPTKKYPVWVFFHGLSEMSKDKADLDRLIGNGNHAGLLAAAEKYKFIVIAPQLVQSYNGWTPGWTVSYTDPVLEYVINNLFTDLSHIVVTGLSLGGGGTWVATTGSYAQYISAAIPICATPQYDQDFSLIAKHNTPVWAFVAKNDPAYYTAQVNTISAINKFNPTPEAKSTIYNTGGHGIWQNVYSTAEVYSWALSQNNSPSTVPAPIPSPSKKILSIVYFSDGSYITVYDDKTSELKR